MCTPADGLPVRMKQFEAEYLIRLINNQNYILINKKKSQTTFLPIGATQIEIALKLKMT